MRRIKTAPIVFVSLGVLLLAGILFLIAPDNESGPIRIGLIAELFDLGQEGRNGAMLAVEDANRNGGVNGRPIELIIRDGGPTPEIAAAAANDLIREKVEIILGPFTSSLCDAVLAVTESAGMLVFSPTAIAPHFSGKDDGFLRLNDPNGADGGRHAKFMIVKRGYRRVSVIADSANFAFAKPLLESFLTTLRTLDGEAATVLRENFRQPVRYSDVAERLLAPKPDAIFLITGAIDSARIIQQIRNVDDATKILVVDWGATPQLIKLGGKSVEGVEFITLFDEFNERAAYIQFTETYQRRFDTTPSFASTAAYDTVKFVLEAMRRREGQQSLKQVILAIGSYRGLFETRTLDAFGDGKIDMQPRYVVIRNARFEPAP